ncbi:MAG: DUF2004 domain-containing protein [Akkermansiaceae bacterium]
MAIDKAEIHRRTKSSLAAIKAAYGSEDDDYGATLFVSHHLEEIESSYWVERFETDSPTPTQIIDTLILRSNFEDEDDIDTFDFTLPGNVTDYVIFVSFGEAGDVEEISMES